MIPQQQFHGQGPSSWAAPTVPPGRPCNNLVNRPTSSTSTPPPGPPSDAPGRLCISLPTKHFLPAAELRKTDVARIADVPSLQQIWINEYEAADESDNSLALGSGEGQPLVSPMQTEFSLTRLVKWMGRANNCVVNKWKKGWVAGFLQKKHRSIIRGQNRLTQLWDGPLHWATAVADFLETIQI